MAELKFKYRLFVYIVGFFSIVFVLRLAYLQVLKGSIYKIKSETQAIKAQIVYPFRGNLYDRDGNLLVYNAPSFSLQISTENFRLDRAPLLGKILGMDSIGVYDLIFQNILNYRFGDVKVLRDLDYETVQKIEEYSDLLPGVEIVVESKRMYNLKARMSHIIGYIQEISAEELKTETYYNLGDYVGRAGLEKYYEMELRGLKGKRFVGVYGSGLKTEKFNEGRADVPVKNGDDLILSIDLKLQSKAEELLEGRRGAIVAIDPNNGEVLALVSKPDYDVSVLSGKNFQENYRQLVNDKNKPLINRAIQSRYPPGSTWKPLMAIAGLEEGVIDERTTFFCGGQLVFGDRAFGCHGAHGNVNVTRAIQASCNVFFYQLALKLQLERISKWGLNFGFGNKTGIDLPFENTGVFPTLEYIKKKFGSLDRTPKGLLLNYGIGQGEISVTPMQMAVYVSAIANGGTIYTPHLVRAIKNSLSNQTTLVNVNSRQLQISPKNLEIVKKGMFDVVNTPGGTAFGIKIPGLDVCGKTGTAQAPQPGQMDHSWFICFAPKDNPKIALVVIVENAGFGAAVAAPIARELLKEFFNIKETVVQVDSLKILPD
ncbi:penicillin-binding protein 2 [Bacteroidetes/Chlorobi group bacterium Naka2016]|jgi:penicillin-binding protein 2|nr:MAG: penicillin-binding protein 2 [Bacteroidetes/Chlorobi group bacterium Naka2016]